MLTMLATSALLGLVGLAGLLVAAYSDGTATQYMGLGVLVLSWFLLVRYHAHRASSGNEERDTG